MKQGCSLSSIINGVQPKYSMETKSECWLSALVVLQGQLVGLCGKTGSSLGLQSRHYSETFLKRGTDFLGIYSCYCGQVPKAQTKQTQEDFCHWSLMSPTMQHFSSLPLELPMSFRSNLSLRSSTRHLYAFFKLKNLIKCSHVHQNLLHYLCKVLYFYKKQNIEV